MSDNKLVKTITDAATLTGLVAGIGWVAKKVLKENFTSDPSSSAMNYVKFTAVMAGSIALKQYLEDLKSFPPAFEINDLKKNSALIYNITMASIAIMAGGAILNAAAFIGGNYLARALGGGDKAALDEKVRHDKALEAYQAAYAKYSRDRTKLLDWIATNTQIKEQAKQNFTNTDYAFKLYNQAHPDKQMIPPKEPKFSDFYQPSQQQKNGELMFVGAGALALGYAAFRFL